MQVDRSAAVRFRDLLVIHFAQPVVGSDRAGVGKDQSADGICDGGILLDAPVVDLEIIIHQFLVVEERGTYVTYLLTLLAVKDIGLCHICVSGLGKNLLNAVLNIFYRDHSIPDLGLEVGCDMERDQIDNAGMILLFDSHESFCDGTVIFIDDCRELSGICLLRTQLQYHEGILSSISSSKLN